MRVRLNTKPIKTSIIILQAEIDKIPPKDLTIIIGDFNAKVGNDNSGYERVMGKHGCGRMNENEEHLVDFCGLNNLVIGGTIFPHKEVHKLTWIPPGGIDKNQIDHIAINGKWRRSLQDVRVRRGADVGSDHHLVTASIKLKLLRASTSCKIQRFDTGKLRDIKTQHDFNLELKNRFQLLEHQTNMEESETIDKQWLEVEEVFKKTSEKILSFKRQKHKEWIKPGTWAFIDNRKELKKKICHTHSDRLKQRLMGQFSNCNKEVKKATRKDRKDLIEGMALEAEKAASEQRVGDVYQITKTLCGYKRNTNMPMKDKQGRLITSEREQASRWKEHFKEVLNRPEPEIAINIASAEQDLEINTEIPSKSEIERAVKNLKTTKK